MPDLNKKANSSGFASKWWTFLAVIMIILCLPSTLAMAAERIRKPAVAGYFYPRDKEGLKKTVDDFISNVKQKQTTGKIIGLMSPHAGYVFSGQVAAYAYRQIKDRNYDTVVIIGPSHRAYIKGASVGNWDAYATPLGKVTVNKEIVDDLLSIGEPFHFL